MIHVTCVSGAPRSVCDVKAPPSGSRVDGELKPGTLLSRPSFLTTLNTSKYFRVDVLKLYQWEKHKQMKLFFFADDVASFTLQSVSRVTAVWDELKGNQEFFLKSEVRLTTHTHT